MLKIGVIRWKGRCHRHPGYAPETDGMGGVRGGCRRCEMLFEIYKHHSSLVRLLREFGARDDSKSRRESAVPERQMSLLDWPSES